MTLFWALAIRKLRMLLQLRVARGFSSRVLVAMSLLTIIPDVLLRETSFVSVSLLEGLLAEYVMPQLRSGKRPDLYYVRNPPGSTAFTKYRVSRFV